MSSEPPITIASSLGSYDVVVGAGAFAPDRTPEPEEVVIADARFAERFGTDAILVEATEDNKTITYGEGLILAMREAGARRSAHLVAVGGGIVQDVATFVASMYMRGVAWTYVPTTLLAMVDSCIGGKSSLNVRGVKNLAGNYYPPARVLVDPGFIATLPEEDVVGGLAEAVKISYCRGEDAFARYLELFAAFDASRAPGDAVPLLRHVLECKQWFIERDEFDRAERRLLNFGHTFGHAIEAATHFGVSHGAAVALGVRCAVAFAAAEQGVRTESADALDAHCAVLLERVPRLAERVAAFDDEAFDRAFRADKKHTPDELHLILPGEAGAHEAALPATDATLAGVRTALTATLAAA